MCLKINEIEKLKIKKNSLVKFLLNCKIFHMQHIHSKQKKFFNYDANINEHTY